MKKTTVKYLLFLWTCFMLLYPANLQADSIPNTNQLRNIAECENWKQVCLKYEKLKTDTSASVNVLFIGDSHIQGGYSTNRIRNLFCEKKINTNRGLIFPYSFINTNGPEDITFASSASWTPQKWNMPESITDSPFGYAVKTSDQKFDIRFGYNNNAQCYPFNKIIIFHSPGNYSITNYNCTEKTKHGSVSTTIDFTELVYKDDMDTVNLSFICDSTKAFTLYGFELQRTEETLTVSSLGINGITYRQYAGKINIEPWLQNLKPDCVILAMGTNDVYALRADTSRVKKAIQSIINKIRMSLPETAIILTTPNDHLIRRRYPNKMLPPLSSIIKQTAIANKCGYWDFFEIMGGFGSAPNWHSKGFLYKDFVHLSKNGYTLQGELFFEAFTTALKL